MSITLVRAYLRDDHGGITQLIMVWLVAILLMTGFGLDLLRQESERADLQDALDRGVLAATSLNQTVDAETIVHEFLENRQMSLSGLSVSIDTDNALNYRRITADAQYQMDTIFLRMVGLGQLTVAAHSAAVQHIQDVEVSLVLDISGSMAREQSGGNGRKRLDVLKTAASAFVDTILTPATRDRTSLTLVPYAGQTNVAILYDHFANGRIHNDSSCIEFTSADFNTTALPPANSRSQVPHFQWFRFEGNYGHNAAWGWCPTNAQTIVPFSNDPDALKTVIQGFQGHDGTGTQNGMKLGLGMLDPSTQPIIQTLVGQGSVGAEFENRPAAFGAEGVLKVIVVMTDGSIRYQQRPVPSAWDTISERDWLRRNNLPSSSAVLGGSSSQNSDEANRVAQFQQLCNLAKQAGVVVFTIGFDVGAGSSAFNEMRNCASSPSHFYNVEGLQLDSAFKQIASTIQKLQLVE